MFMIIFVFDNRNKGAQLNQPVKRPHQIQKEHNDSFVKICIDPHDETMTIKGWLPWAVYCLRYKSIGGVWLTHKYKINNDQSWMYHMVLW